MRAASATMLGGVDVPTYLDHHKAMQIPPETLRQAVEKMKAGMRDPQTGMRAINGFNSKDGKEAWCLIEAPNADVVHKYHEGMGLKLNKGDVTEVQTML